MVKSAPLLLDEPIGETGDGGHDGQGGVGGALGGEGAAVGDEQVGYAEDALVGVDDAVFGAVGHARAADEVGVAGDGHDFLRAGGSQDVFHGLLRSSQECLVVVALGVREVGDG